MITMSIDETTFAKFDQNQWFLMNGSSAIRYESILNNRAIDTRYNLVVEGKHIASIRIIKPVIGNMDKIQANLTICESMSQDGNWFGYSRLRTLLDSLEDDYFPCLLVDLDAMRKLGSWHHVTKYGNIINIETDYEMDCNFKYWLSGVSFDEYASLDS